MGENGEIARRALDVLTRRSFEEAQRLCTADVELWTLYDGPGGEPQYHGREGLRQWFERLDELWAFLEVRDVEIEERENGWVLVRVVARLRGRGSPTEFEPDLAAAVRVADREIAKFGLFSDEADAVAMIAAG